MPRKRTPHEPIARTPRRLYRCEHCGETLSSPGRFYTCPYTSRGDAVHFNQQETFDESLHTKPDPGE